MHWLTYAGKSSCTHYYIWWNKCNHNEMKCIYIFVVKWWVWDIHIKWAIACRLQVDILKISSYSTVLHGCKFTPWRYLVTPLYCMSWYFNFKLLMLYLKQNFVWTAFFFRSSDNHLSKNIFIILLFFLCLLDLPKCHIAFLGNFSHWFLNFFWG